MLTLRARYCFRGMTLISFLAGNSLIVRAAEGDFSAAYSYTAVGQSRTAEPSATAMAGTASFGLFPLPSFLVAGSTQTFISVKAPGPPLIESDMPSLAS